MSAMSAILSVRDLEKTFGSVVAARDISVDVPAAADRRHHRRQRRGQDHLRQHDHRPSASDEGHDPVRGPRHHRPAVARRSRGSASRARSRWRRCSRRMTVFENMCAAAAIARGRDSIARAVCSRRSTRRRRAAEAEAAIELFQIARYRDARAATLPQGVRKLLDIAMAVAGSPRVLLLDEPTSGISIEEKFGLMDVVMSALKTPQDHRAVRRARHGDRRALRRPRAGVLRRHRDRRRERRRPCSPIRRCRP